MQPSGKNNPRISVIMPAYQCASFIDEAIKSILGQSFQDFELIAIYQTSTDGTLARLEEWKKQDARISIYPNYRSKNVAGAINSGLPYARGEYIARADADDICLKDRLLRQIRFLDEQPEIAMVGTWYEVFYESGKTIQVSHPRLPLEIAWKYLFNSYMCHPSVLFRQSLIDKIGFYPEDRFAEDYAYFSKIVSLFPCANLGQSLVRYRVHSSNRSNAVSDLNASVLQTSVEFASRFKIGPDQLETLRRFNDHGDVRLLDTLSIFCTFFGFQSKIRKIYGFQFWSLGSFFVYFRFLKALTLGVWNTGLRKSKSQLKQVLLWDRQDKLQ